MSVWEHVSLGSFHQFAAVNLVGDCFSRTVGCVGDSEIDEPIVCAVGA